MDKWKSRGGKSQRREEKRREEKRREEKREEKRKEKRREEKRKEKRREEKRREKKKEERRKKKEERRKKKEDQRRERVRGKSQRKESEERVRGKSQRKESEERRFRCAKGRKVAKHSVVPMVCGSGGSKSRLAKAAGAEPSGQMRDEKVHAVVAQSTFRSQNLKKTHQATPFSDHFWKLTCRKSARRFGAKHISKSKCQSHHMLVTWRFRYGFAWQAPGIPHLAKN